MLQRQENALFRAEPGKFHLVVVEKETGDPIGVFFLHQGHLYGISTEEVGRVMGPYRDGPEAFKDMFDDE